MALADFAPSRCDHSRPQSKFQETVASGISGTSRKDHRGAPNGRSSTSSCSANAWGSTGVGNGIAIPHGKLVNIHSIVGIFARLEQPVDFEALDDQPVDLVFLLLAPEGAGADHLKALSRIARVLRDHDLVAKLRATDSASAIYAFLNEEQTSNAA